MIGSCEGPAGIASFVLDSGRKLIVKPARIRLDLGEYTAEDILRHFSGESGIFRSDEFRAHFSNQIGVLQVPESSSLSRGLQWVKNK